MLSAMEYRDWMMVAGAVLLVLGFIGFVCSLNKDAEVNLGPKHRREAHSPRRVSRAKRALLMCSPRRHQCASLNLHNQRNRRLPILHRRLRCLFPRVPRATASLENRLFL